MIFHENRLLADDSHVISYLISFRKLRKMLQNLSSAAVVIGALRASINYGIIIGFGMQYIQYVRSSVWYPLVKTPLFYNFPETGEH